MKVEMDMEEVEELEKDLNRFAKNAQPHAVRFTLNGAAFDTMKAGREEVDKNMITRNKWTGRSIQAQKVTTMNMDRMQSSAGSVADYMKTQETGGTKTKKGKEGVTIATPESSGESTIPRKKLARPSNRISRTRGIQLDRSKVRAKNRKQANIIKIKQAAKSGRKHVFLKLNRTKGIFRLKGGKRNPQIRLVQDMTRQSVRIPKNEWLAPATKTATQNIYPTYIKALKFQAKRNKMHWW